MASDIFDTLEAPAATATPAPAGDVFDSLGSAAPAATVEPVIPSAPSPLQREKTRSLFLPEVEEAMTPAYAALEKTAREGGVFGSAPATSLLDPNNLIDRIVEPESTAAAGPVLAAKRQFAQYRDTFAKDFELTPAEADDYLKHRFDLQTEPVSRDVFGGLHIKNDVLSQDTDSIEKAIAASKIPDESKNRLALELPQRLAVFKSSVVNNVRERHPEFAATIKFTGDMEKDYRAIDAELNKTRTSQGLGGAAAGALRTIADGAGGAMQMVAPQISRGTVIDSEAAGQPAQDALERQQSRNQISAELQKSKTELFGTDAAVIGQGAYSVAESVALGAATAGLGELIVPAAQLAKFGPAAARVAQFAKGAANVSPVAGVYGIRQASDTYDQAIESGKSPEEARDLALRAGAIEAGVTMLFSGIGAGGVEDLGARLVSESSKKTLGAALKDVGKGILAENAEESAITALDTLAVQARINPNLTVEDLRKSLYDTLLTTTITTGAAAGSVQGLQRLNATPTHELTDDELRVKADLLLAENAPPPTTDDSQTTQPGTTDSPSSGVAPFDPSQDGVVAVDGAPATEQSGSPAALPPGEQETVSPDIFDGLSTTEATTDGLATTEAIPDGVATTDGTVSDISTTQEIPSEMISEPGQNPGQEIGQSEVEVGESPSNPATPEPVQPDIARDIFTELAPPLDVETPSETPIPEGVEGTTSPSVADTPATTSDIAIPTSETSDMGIPISEIPADVAPVNPQSPTGMRNAIVDAQREKRGLPPRFAPAARTNEQAWSAALAEVDRDPDAGTKLVDSAMSNPVALTPDETALFTHEQLTREQAVDLAFEELGSATDENRAEKLANVEKAEAALSQAYTVGQALGTISGRSLQARKLLVNQDFSLARMLAREQAVNNQGAPLTPKQRTEVTELHVKITQLQRQVQVLEANQARQLAEQTFQNSKREFTQATKEAKKRGEKSLSFIERQAEEARKRIKARRGEGRLNSLPVDELFDHAIVGVSYIAKGVTTLAEFTASLVKDFGERIRTFAPEIFEKSQELHESANEPPSRVKSLETVLEEVEGKEDITGRDIYNLARAYINNGMTEFADVMNAVLAELRKANPELTLRDVHDLYSGYGQVRFPSKEADKVRLREFRTLARLTSQLEDAERGLAPLRTGAQRDPASVRVRELQKQVNATMRRLGIRSVSDEQNLKTSLNTVKTRLRNEIEELDKAIRDRQPRPENRSQVEYDEEAKQLRETRDARKKEYDAIFEKKGISEEDRVQQAEASLTRRIGEQEKMLADGVLTRQRTRDSSPWSPRLSELQGRLDDLRAERQRLREAANPKKAPEDVAYDRATAVAKAAIERYQNILSGNEKAKTPRAPVRPDNELLALIRQRGQLKTAVDTLRAAAKPTVDKDARKRAAAVKALSEQVAELDRKIRTGDLSAKQRPDSSIYDPYISSMRKAQQRMRKTLAEMRRNALPPKDPVAVRLARDKKTIQTRINKIRDRIAREDYAPAVKTTPVMDAEKERLLLEEYKAKQELAARALEALLKQRGAGKKIFDGTLESFHAMRSIMTSFDFGAVLRQGGLVVLANPQRLIRAFPTNFTGWTEKGAFRIKERIEKDPNFLAAKKAGLFIAENSDNVSLTRMEEQYIGRWAKKIPGISNSENAYVSYLNTLRMDSFNALTRSLSSSGNLTEANLKEIANFVNIATGRGNLGSMENAASSFAAIFFSPKYVASRFQFLLGSIRVAGEVATGFQFTDRQTRAARQLIALEYAKTISGIGVVFALAALYASSQDDDDEKKMTISSNPYSSEFGKLKIGNSRIDFLAGLSQTTVFLSRVIGGKTTRGDKTIDLRGENREFGASALSITGKFLRSKLAPLPGTIANLVDGQDAVGEPVTPETELIGSLIPLSFGDIYSVMKEQGAAVGTGLSALSLFGLGTGTYGGKNDVRLEAKIATAVLGTDPARYEKKKKAPVRKIARPKPISRKPPARKTAPTRLR